MADANSPTVAMIVENSLRNSRDLITLPPIRDDTPILIIASFAGQLKPPGRNAAMRPDCDQS